MARYKVEDIRNVALVGHGAVGKTTLADHMLFKAGVAKRQGSVDEGTSMLDVDDDEKERKHSITSTVCHFMHHDKRINLIDTPGYPDFIGQVTGSLRAVETAIIVISATSGIEVNTRRVFDKATDQGLGKMIVINKCDHENLDLPALLSLIQETFGKGCVPMTLPVGTGHDFKGVISALELPEELPPGIPFDPKHISQLLVDATVEADEELMVRYLDGEQISVDELGHAMEKALKEGTLIPIFFTDAKHDVGVTELMDAIALSAIPPTDLDHKAKDTDGNEVVLVQTADAPLVAQVFKTRIDPFVAKMSFIRIYAGSIHKDSMIHCSHAAKAMKFGQPMEAQGYHLDPVDIAGVGEIVVVTKMEELKTGDTLTLHSEFVMDPIPFPTPMIALAVEPKSRNDQTKISGALSKLEDEDPTFHITRDPQTKEMVMNGMSELHLKLIQDRLAKRDHVEMITHQPKIPYREACAGSAEGHYRHKKQSGGSGQFGEVHMKVSHLPQGIDPEEYFTKDRFESLRSYHYDPELNYAFVDRISQGSIPNQYIPACEKGVKERMEKGVLAGFQVQDVVCELYYGKDHPVDSNETAFKIAASRCFKEVFEQAKPVLLEPIVLAEIVVPGEKLGDITSDLNTRRGRVEGLDTLPGGLQVIKAKAPLSEMMTYQRTLSSLTGGEGSFTMQFSHYENVPPQEQQKIVASVGKVHEEED